MSVGRRNSSRTRQAQIAAVNINSVVNQSRGQYSGDQAESWGQTSNCNSTVLVKSETTSPFNKSRKLCAVQRLITTVSVPSLLVDCRSPVTIIRADLWRLARDLSEPVENQPEDFQGVTRDGLRIPWLTKLEMSVGSVRVKHPILIADEIAHKFILENNFLTEHKCDILNSKKLLSLEISAYHTLCSDRPLILFAQSYAQLLLLLAQTRSGSPCVVRCRWKLRARRHSAYIASKWFKR